MKSGQLIQSEKELKEIDLSGEEFVFFSTSAVQNCFSWNYTQKNSLDYFIYGISKNPRKLLSHIQRIFFCYHESHSEQLYAALMDFFLVLNGCGKEISLRMFDGSKSRLSDENRKDLLHFLNGKSGIEAGLQGSRYSLFDNGLIGTNKLIFQNPVPKPREEYGSLKIAQDFIEYSQLDEARIVLENAIMEKSESKEIHEELLSLYRSKEDCADFQRMYAYVKRQGSFMLSRWHDVNASLLESTK